MQEFNTGLRRKRKAFAVEYLKDFNATQAAIRAGYSANGAEATGYQLLRNPQIAAVIDDLCHAAEAATLITKERILREYARLAFFDPSQLYDDGGNLKPINALDKDTAAALTGMDIETLARGDEIIRIRKYRFDSKKGALDSLAKISAMLIERKELTGKNGAPIDVRHALDGISDDQAKRIAEEFLLAIRAD